MILYNFHDKFSFWFFLIVVYIKYYIYETGLQDFDQTTAALRIVTEAAEHANSNVVLQEEFQRMLKLQARLGDWELIKPGTKGVFGRAEGDLVLQRTPPPP